MGFTVVSSAGMNMNMNMNMASASGWERRRRGSRARRTCRRGREEGGRRRRRRPSGATAKRSGGGGRGSTRTSPRSGAWSPAPTRHEPSSERYTKGVEELGGTSSVRDKTVIQASTSRRQSTSSLLAKEKYHSISTCKEGVERTRARGKPPRSDASKDANIREG